MPVNSPKVDDFNLVLDATDVTFDGLPLSGAANAGRPPVIPQYVPWYSSVYGRKSSQ